MRLKSHTSLMTLLWQLGPAADGARTTAVLGPADVVWRRRLLLRTSTSRRQHLQPAPTRSSASRHTLLIDSQVGKSIHLYYSSRNQVMRLVPLVTATTTNYCIQVMKPVMKKQMNIAIA